MSKQYPLHGIAAESHAKSEALHAKAKPCHKCTTRTHNADRANRPLCVACKIDAMPKDPALTNWQVGQWREADDEGAGSI